MDASEIYDPTFREAINEGYWDPRGATAIIPIGSLEQHGAHLPITTDSDIVTEIASRLATKSRKISPSFIVFPTISYGISFEHEPLFSISISKAILKAHLKNIVESLMERGPFRSVIILNGHHGNRKTIDNFVDEWQNNNWSVENREWQKIIENAGGIKLHGAKCKCYHYWEHMKHEFDHAGFVETSIMLAISDKVRMKEAKKGLITKGLSEKEIQRIKKLSTKRGGFPKVAKNGVWGDPTGATKKDGEKFLAEIVRNLAKECQS
jgi:creatinine amidohydrolase